MTAGSDGREKRYNIKVFISDAYCFQIVCKFNVVFAGKKTVLNGEDLLVECTALLIQKIS
jgi:hypothetical protein